MTASESVDILAYEGIINQQTAANNAHKTTASGVPTPAYSSASFRLPSPNFAAMTVLIPTPVPTARAIIKS